MTKPWTVPHSAHVNACRFKVRTENATPAHETLRIFANGASAGLLTLRLDEAVDLRTRLDAHDEFVTALREIADRLDSAAAETDCFNVYEARDIARAALAKVSL